MSPSSPLRVDQAWSIVAISFVITLISTGIRFAAGPFLGPLQQDFGFSLPYLSGVFAAAMLLYGVGMAVAGRLADLWGTRRVLVWGTALVAASLLVAARTTSPLLFALTYALAASFGFAATSQTVLSPLIGRWFDQRRGLAMTILSSGAMGGIAVMTPLSAALVGWLGWRATYLLYALVFLVVLLPIALWALPGAEPPAPAAAGGDPGQPHADPADPAGPAGGGSHPAAIAPALASRPFLYLAVGFFGCGFSMNLLGTHGVPMLEHHGFPTMTAAFGIGLIGLVSIFGSLAVGAPRTGSAGPVSWP